ncbi:MAG TPA: serine/threonine-protein kinase [Gemmatimonadaceae bacterium]|nr:serine/threonine-protein kinase [Gemmatimonadaceae bacterium]
MEDIQQLKVAIADRYLIEGELGRGGMATVYLAEDVKHGRKVALKVLRPELAAMLGPKRFLREIEIAARLTHPHILPLYDSGGAEGMLYYVMPFIEGESLRTRLDREGELPIGDAARILRDLVDAIAHAHRCGVVHRDIKPDNVLFNGRHALITDFGVAKAVTASTGPQHITTAGFAVGTPQYMAPEQAAAEPHADPRSDIYAVGVVGYELLVGRPPFGGVTPREILAAHMSTPPRPVTAHRASVPEPLAHMVMKCLEKRPSQRWQSADELLAHLEEFLGDGTVSPPVRTQPPAAPGTSVERRLALLVTLGIVLLLAALLAVRWL